MSDRWSVREITRTLLPVLLVLTALELLSGLALGSFEATLLRYPSLLVLVPVTIGTAGNLGSVLSARLSTNVHLGLLAFSPADDRLVGNAVASVLLAVTVFPVVGAGAWAVTRATGTARLAAGTVVAVAGVSGLALAVLVVVVALASTYAAVRFELDPDDVVIPTVTNVCDVLGVVVLVVASKVLVAA
ncbi:MAG: magnesium transporter [Haloarculaceae archaeon]